MLSKLKPEMLPSHNFGHRRTRSYFSGFTLSTAQLHAQQRLARSTEKLDQLQLDSNKRAYSARDLSRSSDKEKLEACKVQIEEELELKVQSLLKRKKYKEVTVPISIKFSVSKEQQAFAAMTKPNSATESLDQMLLNIRMKLSTLSNDRVEMERKTEDMMSNIKEIHHQYHFQQKHHHSLPQAALYSSIRRVRSSATSSRKPGHLTTKNVTTVNSSSVNSSSSQDYLMDSLSQDSTISASSQNSISPLPRQRSASAAASLRFKSSAKPSSISMSCDNIEEAWMPHTTIHELPESPTFVSTTSLSDSSNSLHTYSIHGTAPRRNVGYRRSCSVSSPTVCSTVSHEETPIVTSTPNVSQRNKKTEHFHTLPHLPSTQRNSLPDSVMNTAIPEGEVDEGTGSLSQLSTYTDDGSPRNGSTIIARRSSLTGQIEHYRKPHLLNKKNSYSKELSGESLKLSSDCNSSSGSDVEFRVLNKGFRKCLKRQRISQILPSIETTV